MNAQEHVLLGKMINKSLKLAQLSAINMCLAISNVTTTYTVNNVKEDSLYIREQIFPPDMGGENP